MSTPTKQPERSQTRAEKKSSHEHAVHARMHAIKPKKVQKIVTLRWPTAMTIDCALISPGDGVVRPLSSRIKNV